MKIIINKNVTKKEICKNELLFYGSARTGFESLLRELKKIKNYIILLPSYIGYSPNEGSGIYDPIKKLKYDNYFYTIDKNIEINFEDLKSKIISIPGDKILLIVHYFGFVDKNIAEIVNFARENNVVIVEDCAHALFSDFVDRKAGFYGDYCIYSLHKMLPLTDGGMIKINNKKIPISLKSKKKYDLFCYNFNVISKIRKENAKVVYEELKKCDKIKILKYDPSATIQTFPILVNEKIKEKIYFKLNEEGYQVVALYFRIIPEINCKIFKQTNKISKEILNLPIHQDTNVKEIKQMCKLLKQIVGE